MEEYKLSDKIKLDNGDSVVYKIYNTINDSCYVGSSHNIEARINQHYNSLKKNKHSSKELQKDFNNHGEDKFKVLFLRRYREIDEARDAEEQFLKSCNPVYNSNGKILRANFSEIDLFLKKISELTERLDVVEGFLKDRFNIDKTVYYPKYDIAKLKLKTKGKIKHTAALFNVHTATVRRVLNGKQKHLGIITYLIKISKTRKDKLEKL